MKLEEFEAILDEALKECQYEVPENANAISSMLDKAWNRGAFAMLNSAILIFLKKSKEEAC
jgi:hypothetical protein